MKNEPRGLFIEVAYRAQKVAEKCFGYWYQYFYWYWYLTSWKWLWKPVVVNMDTGISQKIWNFISLPPIWPPITFNTFSTPQTTSQPQNIYPHHPPKPWYQNTHTPLHIHPWKHALTIIKIHLYQLYIKMEFEFYGSLHYIGFIHTRFHFNS